MSDNLDTQLSDLRSRLDKLEQVVIPTIIRTFEDELHNRDKKIEDLENLISRK